MNTADQPRRSSPLAITIGRQPGSGGSALGRAVATRLGAAYLDQEILRAAARQLGVEDQSLTDRGERVTKFAERLLRAFAMGAPDDTYTAYPDGSEMIPSIPDEDLFNAQSRAMRELVQLGDSVVIGHAGFHVLRDHPCLVKVFVHANARSRAERIAQEQGATLADARAIVRQADEDRRRFIERISGCDWTNARNYDLCIDSDRVSTELAVEAIVRLAEERRGQCAAAARS
jgi:cytidylate kinase